MKLNRFSEQEITLLFWGINIFCFEIHFNRTYPYYHYHLDLGGLNAHVGKKVKVQGAIL